MTPEGIPWASRCNLSETIALQDTQHRHPAAASVGSRAGNIPGILQELKLTLDGSWLIFHGLHVVHIWFLHSLHMVYIWFIYGLHMVYMWLICGFYMAYIWFIYGLYMVYTQYLGESYSFTNLNSSAIWGWLPYKNHGSIQGEQWGRYKLPRSNGIR